MTVDSSPSMASDLPATPPSQRSVPRTTMALGVSCCWPGAVRRHSGGITGAIAISTSPPAGFFHRNP